MARHGLRWWEIGVSDWATRALTLLGLARALHVPARVRRHPWLMRGGALHLGVAAAILAGRLRR